jgi:hypothetical protein
MCTYMPTVALALLDSARLPARSALVHWLRPLSGYISTTATPYEESAGSRALDIDSIADTGDKDKTYAAMGVAKTIPTVGRF